ncbi:MAG: hypothetical protein LBL90_07135 [Prevotellaceae bacterium]|jgi:hypothetical protein|nr:hypothetical protein [Prevotellaceae bacterium]
MKKIVFAVCFLLLSLVGFGQNKVVLREFSNITFYGIDFSFVKTFGAKESFRDFKSAFEGINNLFITEMKKYDIDKYFKKHASAISIKEVEELNNTIEADNLFGQSPDYVINNDELTAHVKSLPIKGEGVGLIFVAELLNKAKNRGTYHIVFFDIATKEIIDSWKAGGNAGGFGLRNYWGGSVYNMLKSIKIK